MIQALFKPLTLSDVIDRFQSLNIWGGKAPHQPCFLLAVADLAESGGFSDSRVLDIDHPVLVDSFHRYFDAVTDSEDRFKPDRAKPFVALFNQSILQCEFNEEYRMEVDSYLEKVNPSLSQIRRTVTESTVDQGVLKWLLDDSGRQRIRSAIVQRYFPDDRSQLQELIGLNQQVTQYAKRIRKGSGESTDKLPPDHVRDPAFRRVILENYDSRCAASHLQIVLPGITLLDAAHLIPFSESHDDDPRNGIALTPTYHRALDAHLIAPGMDDKWRVSGVLKQALKDEGQSRLDPFRDLEGRDVLQPIEKYKSFSPKREALEWRLDHLRKP